MSGLKTIKEKLLEVSDPKRALVSARFFKTGKGEYGEGDIFLGVTVPVQRKIAHGFPDLSLQNIEKLLQSKVHEYRFTALENLVFQYEKGEIKKKREIFKFYLSHTKGINNWDLVDTSASYIVGNYLFDKDRKILHTLARSKNMWQRRIAIIATHYFISRNDVKDTLFISRILLNDTHDLIHKAVGWSLREAWKKDPELTETFLKSYYKDMARTALRYALERFSKDKRLAYMRGLI